MTGLHLKSRAFRRPVSLEAKVRIDGRTHSAYLVDLTAEGCCIAGTYRIGEWLVINLPDAPERRAQVRWTIWNRTGLRFDRNLCH